MKAREAIYIIVITIMWCVAWPCVTWKTNVSEQQETERLRIRQQAEFINAQRDLTNSLNRATSLIERN